MQSVYFMDEDGNPVDFDSILGSGHTTLYAGNVYYVDGGVSDDTGNGITPATAKKTIGAAIALLSTGDKIIVKAGTYTETGLDLDVNGCEVFFELGAIIDPASGTSFTVSGDYCLVSGMHTISPAAGAIGILVSGNYCHIKEGRVYAGGTGMKVTGAGTVVHDYACGHQTVSGYDIQGIQARFRDCSTVGVGASYGYKISNNVDVGVLERCTSVGHVTSGFHIATGSKDWTILDCSSGAGDGKWIDTDNANVWSNFSYDNIKYNELTLDGNAETKSYNLFKITGVVKIKNIFAYVTTVLSANHTNCFIDLYDGSSVPLSKNTTLTLNAAPVGSLISRDSDASIVLDYQSGANAFITENSNYRTPGTEVIVGEKGDGTSTYVRFTHTTSDAPSSGVLCFHIEWEPITNDGFLEVV